MGKTYFVGNSVDDLLKVDLFYTDQFVYPEIIAEGIRIAGKEEIVAMKLEVVGNAGRKKTSGICMNYYVTFQFVK